MTIGFKTNSPVGGISHDHTPDELIGSHCKGHWTHRVLTDYSQCKVPENVPSGSCSDWTKCSALTVCRPVLCICSCGWSQYKRTPADGGQISCDLVNRSVSADRLPLMIHCNWDRCLSSNSQLTHNGVKITILGVCNKQWLLEGRVSDPEQTSDTVVGRRIPDQILIDGTQIVETCCHHTSLITPTCFLIKTAPLWMRSGAHLLYWAETCVCVCLNWHAACVCLCLYTLQSLFVLVSCESVMSGISEGQTHTYEAIWHACFMCATVSIYVLWLIVKCLLSASKQFQTSSSSGSSVWKVCSSLQTIPNEFGKCPVLCHQQVRDSIYTGSKPRAELPQ